MSPLSDKRHVISTKQFFDREILEKLFESAKVIKDGTFTGRLDGKILATVFYEPSTRTRFSFESAMMRLGGNVITTEAAGQFSSALKGESLEDSIKIISGYADAIVLRHPEVGSAEKAAAVADVPVINAGDGGGQHPTQALLDAFTIYEHFGKIDSLNIAMIGDLLNGRTIHSLLFLLGLYKDLTIQLVAPQRLRLSDDYKDYMTEKGFKFKELESLDELDKNTDVLYVTRVQKERFENAAEYEQLKHFFVVDMSVVGKLKETSIVMHPLPRVGELATEVDSDPRAKYFEQAKNGLYVRQALLAYILG